MINLKVILKVYVHKPVDEFWLELLVFPYTLTTFKLESNTNDRFKSADLHLEEVDTISARGCDSRKR